MKTIILKVEIEVPDDYVIDEPVWVLEDCYLDRKSGCSVIDANELSSDE